MNPHICAYRQKVWHALEFSGRSDSVRALALATQTFLLVSLGVLAIGRRIYSADGLHQREAPVLASFDPQVTRNPWTSAEEPSEDWRLFV